MLLFIYHLPNHCIFSAFLLSFGLKVFSLFCHNLEGSSGHMPSGPMTAYFFRKPLYKFFPGRIQVICQNTNSFPEFFYILYMVEWRN